MGKKLIVKGADFSENGIPHEISLKSSVVMSGLGVFVNNNGGSFNIYQVKSTSSAKNRILWVLDVQEYIGRDIIIENSFESTSSLYSILFSSDLGTLTIDDIPNLTYMPSGQSGGSITTPVTGVEGVANDSNYISYATIPVGAKYLLITNDSSSDDYSKADIYLQPID